MESGRDREMDVVILVTAPLQARVARVCARDHVTAAQVARRMAAQIDERSARARASFVIENDRSLESLRIGTLALASRTLLIRNPAPEPPGAADA
jgi:dephospho-CoA kinase